MSTKKLKICVYAISKNEEAFAKRFCESAVDADLVLVCDTGSSDNTVQALKDCGAVVYQISIMPWRFDKAREAALALIPPDYDICVSLDLDEVLEPGWREEVERLWSNGVTRLRYKFDWSCGVVFFSEKIHSRWGYHWHHPCHEYIRPDPRLKEVYANTEKLLVTHKPDPTKSRGQYLDLLEVSVKEDPHCPRNALYYGRELTFYRRWDQAIVELKRYLQLPGATWVNERCYAMRLLGNSYSALGQDTEATKWYRLACAEAPHTREPWVEIANYFYTKNNWLQCYGNILVALDITHKEIVYTTDPESWGSKPYDLAALSAWNLGYKDQAVLYGTKAVEVNPHDLRLHKNLEFYRS